MTRSSDIALQPFARGVAAALRRRCGVKQGTRLVVGTSGGADSVALLRALHALSARRGWAMALTVAHVHHGVRAEAEGDAEFVRELATTLELPLHLSRIAPASLLGNGEASMRRLRYEALLKVARSENAAIVTAHHADDQLETLLMRMLRGTGVGGLRGIAWRRRLHGVPVLRPMLGTTHAGATEFLRDIGQAWREDATNADASRWRARLRRDVLPVLRELRPDAATKAVALADHAAEVDRVLRGAAACDATERDALRRLPRVVLTRVLRDRLVAAGVDADRLPLRTIRSLARAVADGRGGVRTFRLAGAEVTITRDAVSIAPV